jgi:hypothetical protein
MDFTKIATKQKAPISGGGYTNIRMAFVDDLKFPIYVDTDNSARVSNDIKFKTGAKGWFPVYGTGDKNAISETSAEIRDHDGHTRTFQFWVPGGAIDFRQFMNENGSREVIMLADEDATMSTILVGGGNGLNGSLRAEYSSGQAFMDEKGFTVTVSCDGYGFFPVYTGEGSIQRIVEMQEGETTINAAKGNAFVTSDKNTTAVTITDILNPTIGQTITLKGGGGTTPSKLETTNVKFDLTDDWIGKEGNEIRIYIRDVDDYIELNRVTA